MEKRGKERDLSPEGNGQHGSEAKGAGSAVDRDRRRAMIRVQLREAERTRHRQDVPSVAKKREAGMDTLNLLSGRVHARFGANGRESFALARNVISRLL
jgi:hypothetical protein